MAKISNKIVYPEDRKVTVKDYLIGTDSEDRLRTKTYPLQSVVELISDEITDSMPKRTSDLINDGEDGINRFISEKDLKGRTYQFSNIDIIHITHNLNRYVDVTVIIGTEKVLADVDYIEDLKSIIIRLSKPETGIILLK